MSLSEKISEWSPESSFFNITTLDCHTGGEPLRIITQGFPVLKGKTTLQKRNYCLENYDHLRKALMLEPRGHADMYGALVVEPERTDSHFGALFMHNEGYSSMCGHATIALAKFAVESGLVVKTGYETQIKIDAPCGQIVATAYGENDTIERVSFINVPSFVLYQNESIHIDGLGDLRFDLAFGGAFYVYVKAEDCNLSCDPGNYNELIRLGKTIKKAVQDKFEISHPYESDLSFLYGTIFIEPSKNKGVHSKNVCIFADGEVDRSPTGSGVSGRAAIHYVNNEMQVGESFIIESILDSQFEVEITKTVEYGHHQAVIPRVTGTAFITGKHEFIIDPKDPFKDGFIFR